MRGDVVRMYCGNHALLLHASIRSSVMNVTVARMSDKGRAEHPDRLAQANGQGEKDHQKSCRRNSWDDESSARRLCSGAAGRGVQAMYAAS